LIFFKASLLKTEKLLESALATLNIGSVKPNAKRLPPIVIMMAPIPLTEFTNAPMIPEIPTAAKAAAAENVVATSRHPQPMNNIAEIIISGVNVVRNIIAASLLVLEHVFSASLVVALLFISFVSFSSLKRMSDKFLR
jgi:hypothetical protein